MTDVDIVDLSNQLLKTVTSYKPVFGDAIPTTDAMKTAFKKYSRHHFVDRFRLVSEMWDGPVRSQNDSDAFALIYSNQPLMYVGDRGETFQASSSEPAFIMHLLAALKIENGNRALEIGCGTGWLLAMMADLCGSPRNVTGIEIIPELVKQAETNLSKVGLGDVEVRLGDGNTLPSDIGSFERIMYTASTYSFPGYLFDICEVGGRVVIPLRNKGLAEEVQILERTREGFQSIASRVCKFVQMTQQFGADRSGIQPSDDNLRVNLAKADNEVLEIPGGPPGTLAFSSFMSKTHSDFAVLGLSDPKIQTGFKSGVFGDPSAIGLAILSNDWSSGAVWNRGILRSFGDEQQKKTFSRGLSEWIKLDQPIGAQFKLKITSGKADKAPINGARNWREQRENIFFDWSI